MSSVLRTQFQNYMTLRGFSPKTKTAYINAVYGLAKYYKQSPDQLSNEQIQTYLVYLIEEKRLAWSSCNIVFSGLRSFYGHVLKRNKTEFHIPSRPRHLQLPVILSTDEVRRLIEGSENPKHKLLLKTVYAAGLRVSEVVRLKPEHIESSRMLIRVEEAKGNKDRYTILAESLLIELRNYWQTYRPGTWIFFGSHRSEPMSIDTAQKVYYHAKEKSGITKGKGIHTLRHCFATHMLEQGVDIYTLQKMMGHSSLSTTAVYLHITKERIASVRSPLDAIYKQEAGS